MRCKGSKVTDLSRLTPQVLSLCLLGQSFLQILLVKTYVARSNWNSLDMLGSPSVISFGFVNSSFLFLFFSPFYLWVHVHLRSIFWFIYVSRMSKNEFWEVVKVMMRYLYVVLRNWELFQLFLSSLVNLRAQGIVELSTGQRFAIHNTTCIAYAIL